MPKSGNDPSRRGGVAPRRAAIERLGEMQFPHHTGRSDGARHADAPDRGDAGWKPSMRDSYWPLELFWDAAQQDNDIGRRRAVRRRSTGS